MRLVIHSDDSEDIQSLWGWLSEEPEVVPYLQQGDRQPKDAMGPSLEIILLFATSAAGVISILARSLSNWLIQREIQGRSDVTIKITPGSAGKSLLITAKRVTDLDHLLTTAVNEARSLDTSEESQ